MPCAGTALARVACDDRQQGHARLHRPETALDCDARAGELRGHQARSAPEGLSAPDSDWRSDRGCLGRVGIAVARCRAPGLVGRTAVRNWLVAPPDAAYRRGLRPCGTAAERAGAALGND